MHMHLKSETNPIKHLQRFTNNKADDAFNFVGFTETTYKKGVGIAFSTDADVFEHGKNALEFGYIGRGGNARDGSYSECYYYFGDPIEYRS